MQYILKSSRSRYIRLLAAILLFTALFLAGISTRSIAQAAGSPCFALQPVLYDPGQPATKSYFIFNTHAGTTLYNRVRVTNSGTATGTLHLYSVDATTSRPVVLSIFHPIIHQRM